MEKVYVPAVLFFVLDHSEYLGHHVVYTPFFSVTAGAIHTRGEFANTNEFIKGGGQLNVDLGLLS